MSEGILHFLRIPKIVRDHSRLSLVCLARLANGRADYRSSVQGLKKAVVNTSSTPTKSLLKKPQSSTPAAAKSAARKKAKDYF